MVVYAGALGCYIALMLLVISMEEGGDNLSAFSVSLTEAVVLLSQGSGFKTGSITLTIMPLLLTVLLIALIASLAKRSGTSLSGCVAGTIGWVLINVFFANSLDIKLIDTTGVVAVKTAIVFVLGYAIAAIPESPLTKRDLDWISEHVSSPVRKTVTIGVALGVLLITVYLVIGLIVVLYWAFSNQSAMVKLYELSGMQNGFSHPHHDRHDRLDSKYRDLGYFPGIRGRFFDWRSSGIHHVERSGVGIAVSADIRFASSSD